MATIIFLGAPSPSDLHRSPSEYHWRIVSSKSMTDAVYPPATLEAASRRISLMYQNVIFDDSEDEEKVDNKEDETAITWPPTAEGEQSQSPNENSIPSFLDVSKSIAPNNTRFESQYETQESQTFNYSDAASIARFPTFHFSLNSLSSLSSLAKSKSKGAAKVTLLLAVFEVDGPDTFRFKKGKDAGKESFVLRMILGDEEGNVCKLTAWREVAQDWGGCSNEIGAKRGDVLLLTGVMAAFEPSATVTLTASPWQKPKMEICYRTMPYASEDQRLRPDLRLGASDASVRKVATVVRWFESMAGLANN